MSAYERFKAIYNEIDILIEKKVTCEDEAFITWHTRADRFIRKQYGDGPDPRIFLRLGLVYWCGILAQRKKIRLKHANMT